MTHLALGDQLIERAERLLDRGDAVGLVVLVQVDAVGAQPAQRLLHGVPHVPRRAARAVPVGLLAHAHAELRGQHDLVAVALERDAEQTFAVAGRRAAVRAVDVGGVEQGDPGVQRRVHDGAGAVLVEPGGDVVAAQADRRDERAVTAEAPVAHGHLPA
ncbi:hypothetical protein GCM10029978_056450 [Actinoallomurus acanthiterrae]